MKKKSSYIIACLMGISALFFASCSDFLDEDLTTSQNLDYYKTEEGIFSLATATYYQVFSAPNNEWLYCYTNYGTDEFQVGGDGSNGSFNNYDAGLASIVPSVNGNTIRAYDFWDCMYLGIGYANLLIKSVNTISSTNEQIKKTALGEGYFFRGYNYLRLVRQFGGVPLKYEPSETVEREFTRASAQEVLNQVVEDLKMAYDLLPPSVSMDGKLTKDAAAHFLAKAYLTRASEMNDAWNESTKEADLNEVVRLADLVIANHPLARNYADLWRYTKPNDANESLSEIIISAQYSSQESYKGQNKQHLYFMSRYDDLTYMQRDLSGGRPYSRLGTTYYMYRIFDMQNDSRFWKSFKTKHRLNNASGDYYKNGDLGIMYVVNQPGDLRFSSMYLKDLVIYDKTGKTIPHVYVAYPDGNTQDGALYADARFPSCSKHLDASRLTMNDEKGFRDLILARSADTYLFAAEAHIRLGNFDDALTYINKVRERAAYKEEENRSVYTDGGAAYPSSSANQNPDINSYLPENSYYESNNIVVTTVATDLEVNDIGHLPTEDEYIISKLGYTSHYDRMLCFLLNERARELCGEFQRWEDLARTKTLVPRVKAFNPDAAANIKEHHLLRPIPQSYLDGIQKDGRALTPEEKKAQQNPGY